MNTPTALVVAFALPLHPRRRMGVGRGVDDDMSAIQIYYMASTTSGEIACYDWRRRITCWFRQTFYLQKQRKETLKINEFSK